MYTSLPKTNVTPIITSSAASDRLAQTDAGNLKSLLLLLFILFSFY